jgi:hypothetical protein
MHCTPRIISTGGDNTLLQQLNELVRKRCKIHKYTLFHFEALKVVFIDFQRVEEERIQLVGNLHLKNLGQEDNEPLELLVCFVVRTRQSEFCIRLFI